MRPPKLVKMSSRVMIHVTNATSTTIHRAYTRNSALRLMCLKRPARAYAYTAKLIAPAIMRALSTNCKGSEW